MSTIKENYQRAMWREINNMSYQMTHLEVAYKLIDQYKWIDVQPDFLLGAIAPDAVHFHEAYSFGTI